MIDMITPNFSKSEMACRCGCGIYEMDDEFMRMLQELRNEMSGCLETTNQLSPGWTMEYGGGFILFLSRSLFRRSNKDHRRR